MQARARIIATSVTCLLLVGAVMAVVQHSYYRDVPLSLEAWAEPARGYAPLDVALHAIASTPPGQTYVLTQTRGDGQGGTAMEIPGGGVTRIPSERGGESNMLGFLPGIYTYDVYLFEYRYKKPIGDERPFEPPPGVPFAHATVTITVLEPPAPLPTLLVNATLATDAACSTCQILRTTDVCQGFLTDRNGTDCTWLPLDEETWNRPFTVTTSSPHTWVGLEFRSGCDPASGKHGATPAAANPSGEVPEGAGCVVFWTTPDAGGFTFQVVG